jgi:phosphohistidine phosphatase
VKQLLVMRHAKSDWDAEYGPDHERPLNRRGVEAARLMGRRLTSLGLAPEHVISSTALRARTTAELAAESGGWDCPIELEPDFYGNGADAVMERVARGPDVERMMIVGHQPTWGTLVARLTGEQVEMKTAAVAVVEMPSWTDLAGKPFRLVGVHHP